MENLGHYLRGLFNFPSVNLGIRGGYIKIYTKILLKVFLTIGWDFICEKIIFVTKVVPEIYLFKL